MNTTRRKPRRRADLSRTGEEGPRGGRGRGRPEDNQRWALKSWHLRARGAAHAPPSLRGGLPLNKQGETYQESPSSPQVAGTLPHPGKPLTAADTAGESKGGTTILEPNRDEGRPAKDDRTTRSGGRGRPPRSDHARSRDPGVRGGHGGAAGYSEAARREPPAQHGTTTSNGEATAEREKRTERRRDEGEGGDDKRRREEDGANAQREHSTQQASQQQALPQPPRAQSG